MGSVELQLDELKKVVCVPVKPDMTLIRIGLLDACPDAFDAVFERERDLASPGS